MVQRPSLSDFGLTVDDVARCKRWEQRMRDMWWLVPLRIVAFVAGGFLLAGFTMKSNTAAGLGACLGLVLSFEAFWEPWVTRTFIPALPRHQKYLAAVSAFEASELETAERERRRRAESEAQELRRRGDFWRELQGHAFERELASLFERAGYDVTRTRGSGDGGIDIVVRREGKVSIVQCKQTKHPVGPGVARDLYGALTHCGADNGILAVTAGVTSGVNDFFRGKKLRVMDLTEILALQEATRR